MGRTRRTRYRFGAYLIRKDIGRLVIIEEGLGD